MATRFFSPIAMACFVSVTSTVALAEEPVSQQKIERGHDIANMVCAVCHVIGATQDETPILRNPAPDFRVIANQPGTTKEQLTAFLRVKHPTGVDSMPPPLLSDEMIDAVTAYIINLRTQQ
jgi:mono/diheme cytochrome c family protein